MIADCFIDEDDKYNLLAEMSSADPASQARWDYFTSHCSALSVTNVDIRDDDSRR